MLHTEMPPIYLNGERVSIVEHEKHLGNYVSTDIAHRNIIADYVIFINAVRNLLISNFRVCDSIPLDSLHKIYCMHVLICNIYDMPTFLIGCVV